MTIPYYFTYCFTLILSKLVYAGSLEEPKVLTRENKGDSSQSPGNAVLAELDSLMQTVEKFLVFKNAEQSQLEDIIHQQNLHITNMDKELSENGWIYKAIEEGSKCIQQMEKVRMNSAPYFHETEALNSLGAQLLELEQEGLNTVPLEERRALPSLSQERKPRVEYQRQKLNAPVKPMAHLTRLTLPTSNTPGVNTPNSSGKELAKITPYPFIQSRKFDTLPSRTKLEQINTLYPRKSTSSKNFSPRQLKKMDTLEKYPQTTRKEHKEKNNPLLAQYHQRNKALEKQLALQKKSNIALFEKNFRNLEKHKIRYEKLERVLKEYSKFIKDQFPGFKYSSKKLGDLAQQFKNWKESTASAPSFASKSLAKASPLKPH